MGKRIRTAGDLLLLDMKNNRIAFLGIAAYMSFMILTLGEVCPLYILTGIPCAGCGMTRAGILLLTGHFVQAFHMHAFIYAWTLYLLYIMFCRYMLQRPAPCGMHILIGMAVLMLVYYGYRMYCYFPDREPLVWSKHFTCIDVRGILAHLQNRGV